MPSTSSAAAAAAAAAKKQPLTLAQLSTYDDILTDALVDHLYYWTTIPKNRPSYHASRGVREEDMAKIVQAHLIVDPDMDVAESKLLATDGLRRFHNALKTPKEKSDFRQHLRRYMQIYLPDCPFEVSSTNRYTITTQEARVTARQFIRRGQAVKYLSGIQVLISRTEEEALSARKKDFSIVVSSRSKCASLFMGPARFANHDCGANARLMITGQGGIEIIATRTIEVGDEITVTYGDNYFGEANSECLCQTCEDNLVNGWAQVEGVSPIKKSIEGPHGDGYSLRHRRRDDSAASTSRTPSDTPDIRPKILRTRPKAVKTGSERPVSAGSAISGSASPQKRKRDLDLLKTPPITPSKRRKESDVNTESATASGSSSRSSSENVFSIKSDAESSGAEQAAADATTPEEETCAAPLLPKPTPADETSAGKGGGDAPGISTSLPSAQATEIIVANPREPKLIPTIETSGIVEGDGEIKDSITVKDGDVSPMDIGALPPPVAPLTASVITVATTAAPQPRANSSTPRGRPRHRGGVPGKPVEEDQASGGIPKRKVRTPGDYSLTPVLLSESHTAWVHCTICSEPFLQQDAYYTRSACPRCERHSKLYGYQWPKTEPEGKNDKEERILDHRMVHRFLNRGDEMRIRGRKLPTGGSRSETPNGVSRGRSQHRTITDKMAGVLGSGSGNATDSSRRSGRRRQPSNKAIGC